MIPLYVNGKFLNLNNLGEIVKCPKQGKPMQYNTFWEWAQRLYGSKNIERSYWVLMTKDVIPGSRAKDYEVQKNLIEKVADYEMPKMIEAATVIFMYTFKTEGCYIYPSEKLGKQNTITRCIEKVPGEDWLFGVGGATETGLGIFSSGVKRPSKGVAAVRKFLLD